MLQKSRLKWTGHVVRTPDPRIPMNLFYGKLLDDLHSRGGQKKYYKDTLKASFRAFDISILGCRKS